MASPQVVIQTIDQSSRVPGFPGVIGGIVIPAVKGSVDELELVTDENQLLNLLTANGKIEIGYDNSYWSALAFLTSANRLYVARASNNALYGGAIVKTSPSANSNAAVVAGMSDPLAYSFSAVAVPAAAEITSFYAESDGTLGAEITATALGGMTIGTRYIITNVGTTNFITCGAQANEIGSIFTSTAVGGVGTTGRVKPLVNSRNLDGQYIEFSSPTVDYYLWFGVGMAWQKGALIQVGDYVVPTTLTAAMAGKIWKCTTGGGGLTTGAAEPIAWNTTIGGTTVDNGIVWTTMAITDMTTDPSPTGKTGISVAIPEGALDTVVAANMEKMVDVLAGVFSSTPVANVLTITNLVTGTINTAPTNGGTGWTIDPIITQQGTDASTTEDAFLLYALNPGEWNNDISVQIYNYRLSPTVVKEPNAFLISVYYNSVLVESWVCSMIEGTKDGYGNNIYVEDVLLQSEYIRAYEASSGLLYPKEQTVSLTFAMGSDGSAVTDSSMITALGKFNNVNDAPITLMMDGGWATRAYQRAVDSLCSTRQDCVGILSTPYSTESASNYMTSISNYRKVTLNLNSSFSALYSPHVLINDKYNDRELYVSPDGYAAAVISRTFANYELWYPAAGFRRGLLDVLDVRRRFTKSELDALYDIQINPIRFAVGRGILIWGQKTLTTRPSSLDRLNVRLLLIYIQPAIANTLEQNFLFEFNDEITRSQATAVVANYMENIKTRRGVYAYKVVCDTTNNTPVVIDNNEMYLDLYIQPTKSVETIYFRTIITSTGVSLA